MIVRLLSSILLFLKCTLAVAYVGGLPPAENFNSVLHIVGSASRCSGAKIAKNMILTARHCVVGHLEVGGDILLVTVTGYASGSKALEAKITDINLAPTVDEDRWPIVPDLAVITTDRELHLWQSARIDETEIQESDRLWVGGFGCKGRGVDDKYEIYTGDYKRPYNLFPAEVEFDVHPYSGSMLSYACRGDSGGPVLRKGGGYDVIVAVMKNVSYPEDEFTVDTKTGALILLPTATRPIKFAAEKIHSQSKVILTWLHSFLPYAAFTYY